MHIKATGKIIFSEWLTTVANERAESHSANALQYDYTNFTNLGAVVSLP